MNGSQLILVKQVLPETTRPWRLLEIYLSCDGPRTRVTEGTYVTEDEAREEMETRGK